MGSAQMPTMAAAAARRSKAAAAAAAQPKEAARFAARSMAEAQMQLAGRWHTRLGVATSTREPHCLRVRVATNEGWPESLATAAAAAAAAATVASARSPAAAASARSQR